jgi:hypothetical protein
MQVNRIGCQPSSSDVIELISNPRRSVVSFRAPPSPVPQASQETLEKDAGPDHGNG